MVLLSFFEGLQSYNLLLDEIIDEIMLLCRSS